MRTGELPKILPRLIFQLDIAGFSVAILNELVTGPSKDDDDCTKNWGFMIPAGADSTATRIVVRHGAHSQIPRRYPRNPFCVSLHLGDRSCFPARRLLTGVTAVASRRLVWAWLQTERLERQAVAAQPVVG